MCKSEKAAEYIAIMKDIKGNIYNSNWFFAWYNPTEFRRGKRFVNLDRKEILKIYKDQNYFKEIIDKICEEERIIRDKFLCKIKK